MFVFLFGFFPSSNIKPPVSDIHASRLGPFFPLNCWAILCHGTAEKKGCQRRARHSSRRDRPVTPGPAVGAC